MPTRKALDPHTLRSLSRRFRSDSAGPKRNYEASRKHKPIDAESVGYWRGWYCALLQLSEELRHDARFFESRALAKQPRKLTPATTLCGPVPSKSRKKAK
jgi:hypothetical protein